MIYTIDTDGLCFELDVEATSWHYEDNSIGQYDFSGYVYYDDRHRELVVDEYNIVNKSSFTLPELTVIGELIDDDDIKDALAYELTERLEDYEEEDDF